jgi:type II secretory pathway pseudopilin PulG
MTRKKGFTLIELVLYIGIVGIVSGMLIGSFFFILKMKTKAEIADAVLANAESAMEAMLFEIKHAQSIYTPMSVFGVHPGELSLVTTENLPPDETVTYVDFFPNNQFYKKREGQLPELLVGESVKITNLVFTHLYPGTNYPSIRVSLTVAYDTPIEELAEETAVTLVGTASLRSY